MFEIRLGAFKKIDGRTVFGYDNLVTDNLMNNQEKVTIWTLAIYADQSQNDFNGFLKICISYILIFVDSF